MSDTEAREAFGSRKARVDGTVPSQGGAGGGGVRINPSGVLEVTEGSTCFLPYVDAQRLMMTTATGVAGVAGVAGGAMLGMRRRR